MTAVAAINPHIKNITAPDELRQLQGWLIWRYEHHDGEAKPRKVPYYTNGGKRHGVQGRPEDRNQLTTFDAAKAAAARRAFDGVGLAPLPEFGITALDFDNCVHDGQLARDVEQLVSCTYAEYSPSGLGVRAFMRGDLGNRKAPTTATGFGFETFASKGFVTFTGNPLDITTLAGNDNTIATITDEVRNLCADRFGRPVAPVDDDPLMTYEPTLGLTPALILEALDVLDPDMAHDAWLHVGMGIHHETGGEGFAIWQQWSERGSKFPGEALLKKRWESFGQNTSRPVTARYLLKLAHENGARISIDAVTLEDFDNVASQAPGEERLRYQVVNAGEFSRGKRPGWVMKGVIPKAELVVLFGESGSGKSFVALDMVAAIARGIDWRGHRTQQGRVVYIAAEGGGGFRNRLAAYEMHHGIKLDELPLGIIHATPNFLQKADAIDVAKAIMHCDGADVIVVDTFAQVTPGANENAAEDIGKALAHCKGIHRATGAVVILVHHAGKDLTKGARGWSGLRAAADAEIEVSRTPGGRMLRLSKQKDGEDGKEFGFDLEIVPIGMDEDGDVIDSCVVREAEVPVTSKNADKKRPMGLWEKLVLQVAGEFGRDQTEGIEIDAVLDEVVRRSPQPEDGQRDRRKYKARRALMALCDDENALFFADGDCLTMLQ